MSLKALFFDLDDTLLGNDLHQFLPAYFQRLVAHMPRTIEPQQFINALLHGTQAIIANEEPTRNLFRIFAEDFSHTLQWDEAQWTPHFETFYQNGYRDLQSVTVLRPEARPLIEWALAQNLQIVIATAPLFPLAAIQERLRWAGLADLPFAHITSIETSHYAKPHPEYIAEILARLNLRPAEALFIGNDWQDDITPAATLGLPTFWIAPPESAYPTDIAAPPVGTGTLNDFWTWLRLALPHYQPPPILPAALPFLLRGDLALLHEYLRDTPQWTHRPSAQEWMLTEIVCHLRDAAREVNLPRIRAILSIDNPFLPAVNPDVWAAERNYAAQSGPTALQEFTAARREELLLLEGLPLIAWQRPARHAIFGPTTLAEIIGFMIDHSRVHLEQIRKTVATRAQK